jgi:hypothetical protein
MQMMEIYVSTDVEADGPIPGPNSMLSFGSAAYTGKKELLQFGPDACGAIMEQMGEIWRTEDSSAGLKGGECNPRPACH